MGFAQAIYSGDGEWYEATVKGVSDTGDFVVSFDAYEHEETVKPPFLLPSLRKGARHMHTHTLKRLANRDARLRQA